MIRTPQFWHQPPGLMAYGLWPLGRLYGAATAWRQSRASQAADPPCPVICVGNINAGGTGKTPAVIALAEHLKSVAGRLLPYRAAMAALSLCQFWWILKHMVRRKWATNPC